MNISVYSRNRLYATFKLWDGDFADPIANYLVYGYEPGSCFTAVLANDFLRAVACSHPSNTIEAFKALAGWIREYMPKQACGSYANVSAWIALSPEARRTVLEKHRLIYTPKEETWVALKGEEELV